VVGRGGKETSGHRLAFCCEADREMVKVDCMTCLVRLGREGTPAVLQDRHIL
jgi:hypothetical protein